MRKILIIALCVAFCLLTGCQAKEKNAVFKAEILEMEDGEMLVKPLERYPEGQHAKVIRVPIQHVEASREPVVGDMVEIIYNGLMQEEDPPVACGVRSIKVLTVKTIPTA